MQAGIQVGIFGMQRRRDEKGHISEISSLIIESTAVSLTASLLCELVKRKEYIVVLDRDLCEIVV